MKRQKLFAILLALIMLMQFPMTAFAAATTYSPYVKGTYSQQAKMQSYTVVHGLDLSYHNGTVNYASLKKQGVEFVILRVGYRGNGDSGKLVYDTQFDKNYADAKAAGLKIGTYFYSQALNTTEAQAEANYMLKKISGLQMDLPVYYDYEFAGVDDGRLDKAWKNGTVTRTMMTNNVNAFCSVIRDAGFVPGLYSNTDFLTYKYYTANIDPDISVWNAHYTSYSSSTKKYGATGYTGDYDMWQYSSTGTVYGVHIEDKKNNPNGTKYYVVDCNFMYKELMDERMSGTRFTVSKITDQAYTGKEIRPNFTVTYNGTTLSKGDDYYVSYSDNTEIGTAKVTITCINDYEELKTGVKTFNIVPTKVENLTFTKNTASSVSFKWDKHSDATRYRVQTKVNGKWKTYKDTKNTSFTITGLAPASTTTVRVGTIKTLGGKDYIGKSCAGIDMTTLPDKVTGIKNAYVSVNKIKLTWTKQTGASYYNIYLYNEKTGAYDYIRSTTANSAEFLKLKTNAKFKFKIRAVKTMSDGTKLYGAKSDAFTTYTYPSMPTITSATSKAAKKITVKWKKVSGAHGYQVEWSTSKNFKSNFLTKNVDSAKAVSKVITTSKSKKTYYVRVRSYRKHGNTKVYSYWSNALKVKTK